MKYSLHFLNSNKKKIEILQELPDKGDKFPTILLVPGFGMDLHEYGFFDEASVVLVRNGFQTFRFSFEGTGKSQGNFTEMTVESQVQQLRDVINFITKDRFVDKSRVAIFAQSYGTVVTTISMPLPEIKTLAYTSAPHDPYTSLSKWFKRERGFDPVGESVINRSDGRKTRIGPKFWESLQKFNLISEIKKVTQPILLIHGSFDQRVPILEAEDLYLAVQGRKKLHIVEKADHAFTGRFRLPVLKLIAQWFLEEL